MSALDSGVLKLLPKDDAYVNGGTKQEQNFGAESTIHVKYSNELDKEPANIKYCRISYLKFDLSQIKGKIKSAVLKLYCSSMPNGTPVPVTISAVDDDSWSEDQDHLGERAESRRQAADGRQSIRRARPTAST